MLNKQILCVDFIKLHLNKGHSWDPMEAVTYLNNRWGTNLDWHDMASALDSMKANKQISLYPYQQGFYKKYEIATPVTD